jgi:UDP-N-acetylmuramoyl-tripeptide--D-alanyl-D-alanine ligase
MKLSESDKVLKTQMIGKYNFYNYLAAAAFGSYFDVPFNDICDAIEEYNPTNNRSQVKKTENNTLILDCYNANPSSMKSALESFAMNVHPQKIMILGDMKELGVDSDSEHQKVVEQMEALKLKGIVVGEEFSKIHSPSIIGSFNTSEDLDKHLSSHAISDHLILLKGSRSIKLEILENSL